ncbi:MAG: hypothetical protein ACRDPC_18660 [Solirubrobacteraceae bacterium]
MEARMFRCASLVARSRGPRRPTIRPYEKADSKVHVLASELTHLLDEGVRVDLEETRERLSNGTVLDWFEEQFKGEPHYVDISLYDADERWTIMRALDNIAVAFNARRKFGVKNNGIALLHACAVQVMHGGAEEYERED